MWGRKSRAAGPRFIAPVALILAQCGASTAWAGSFSVNPVQINLPAGQRAASLTIRNSDAAPVSIRAQALAWTQVGGIDRYAATTNIIVSPPIFTIAPGATQLVRVGPKDASVGGAYRIILEEIPKQNPTPGQVQIRLRLNLPLYLVPAAGGKSDVHWRALRANDGTISIEGRNLGTLHQQVTELDAEQDGKTEVLSRQMGVILPGSARLWTVAPEAHLRPGAPFILQVKSPSGDSQSRIALELR